MQKKKDLFSVVVIAVVLAVGILLTLAIQQIQTLKNVTETTKDNLVGSAANQAVMLDTMLNGQADLLSSMALSISKQDDLDMTFEDKLKCRGMASQMRTLCEPTLFNFLILVDPNGNALYSDETQRDLSDRWYFRTARAGRPAIEKLSAGHTDGQPRFIMAVPVKSEGKVIGVLAGALEPQTFAEVILPSSQSDESTSLIINADGSILASTRGVDDININSMVFYDMFSEEDFYDGYSKEQLTIDLHADETGSFSSKYEGERQLVVFQRMKFSIQSMRVWYIVSFTPDSVIKKEVSAAMKGQSFFLGLIALCTLLATTLVMWHERKNARLLREESEQLRKREHDLHEAMEELRRSEDALHLSEQTLSIAVRSSKREVIRYDIRSDKCYYNPEDMEAEPFSQVLDNACEALIEKKHIAEEGCEAFRAFFERLRDGESPLSADFPVEEADTERLWMRLNAVTVFSAEETPEYAVISIDDVTEQRKKEIAYSRWQQTLSAMPDKSTTVHQWNLSSDRIESRRGETEFSVKLEPEMGFNGAAKKLADSSVHKDDRDGFLELMNRERLLGSFYDNNCDKELEYRLRINNRYRWMHLSIQLVTYPDSSDIQAFIVTRDIDAEKRRELELIESRDRDALTGTLNRQAFIERVTKILQSGDDGQNHVLMIVDVDNFKSVNDNFGHIVGDRVLSETAGCLRSSLRSADLLGRLGGDEFMIFMNNVPYDAFIEKRAEQICRQVSRRVGKNVLIGASIGIAVFPRDGTDFNLLYEMADDALYKVKQDGGNNYAFYRSESENEPQVELGMDAAEESCLLIADDTKEVLSFCEELFEGSYNVVNADSGAMTLSLLRKLGQKVAALIVHLTEHEADSRELLNWLRDAQYAENIPVLVVGTPEDEMTALQYIDAGAFDFIPLPVDHGFLLQRVDSAIHSARRVRDRAQSNFLRLQSDEEERFRHVLEATGTVVFTYDTESEIFAYDDLTSRYLAGKYDKRPLWKILLSDMVARLSDVKEMQELCKKLAADPEHESAEMYVQLRAANKKLRWFRMQLIKRSENNMFSGKMLMTFNDVHDEVVTKNSMRYRAEHDVLTGLLNRETFLSRLNELVPAKEPGCYMLACMDLDNFKVVNDQFGHATGDRILKDIAAKVQLSMDGCSGICCRIGADTFAALYPASAASDCENDEVWIQLDKQLKQEARPYHVTFHVGRYRIADLSLQPELMLDRALMAQRSVHNDAVRRIADYDESERLRILEEQKIVEMMEWALSDGQFVIYLQPQYSRSSGMITGVETLVRWNHPEQGMIMPGRFIPLFEKNGFITRLDHFVWEESCALLRKWLDDGRNIVPLSVNVSRVDIFDEGLCDDLMALVDKYELTRDMLRLEITETAYSDQPEQFLKAIERLRNEGFLVEMDDFGSGYSSLNILKNCPIDVLKLDMGFLSDKEGESVRGGNIIASVVRMARLLGIPMIAEGVETQKQADFLHSIGCDVMQGYLFAKPMPVHEFETKMGDKASYTSLLTETRGDGLDIGAFWDPNSFESLMFNTYVGAAAILEFRDEKFELLRANRKYLNMFHLHAGQMDEYCINFEKLFMPGQRELYYEMIARAIESPDGEAVCVTQRKVSEELDIMWIRTNIRIIAKDKDRVEFYCIAEDVTTERETMERLTRSEDTLQTAASHAQIFYWEYDCLTGNCIQDERGQKEFGQPEVVEDYPECIIREGRLASEYCEAYREMHKKVREGIPEIGMDVYRLDVERWYHVQYTNLLDKDGKIIRTIGTARCIEPPEGINTNTGKED